MKKIYLLALTLFSIIASGQNYDYTIYDTSNSGIGSNYIGDIKIDANGMLWISSYSGVATFNGTTWANYNTSNSGIASNAIVEIEIDGLGKKWMASQNNGIILLNGTTWTNYTTSNSGLPNNAITCIDVDSSNNLWIATESGLTRFNGTTWTTYNALTNINSIEIDSNNGIWVTNNGVLYKFNGSDFNFIAQGTEKILKISGTTLYIDGYDGMFTYSTSGTLLGAYYQSNSCLAGYQLNALDVDSNNDVWIAFQGDGLQNFTDCTSYTTSNSGLPDNYFSALRTQASGTIWVGTLQLGLVKMTPSTTTCNPPTQFWAENITATSATLNWIPSTSAPNGGYLYVYNTTNEIGGTDGSTTSTSDSIDGLTPNTDYHWWVASLCGNDQSAWVYGGQFTTLQETANCWKQLSSGQQFTVAIKADGSLWSWGANAFGQLGNGPTSNTNVPTQIGTATNWKSVSCGSAHTLAIKTDGTLWAWGNNFYGYLGDGTAVAKNTPIQIGTATNWEKVTAGNTHSFAIKSNGTLWAWGYNNKGQLGDGTTTNRNVPTQIGTATNWQSIGAGNLHSMAVKTNGTLWAWGSNDKGQLGDGTTTNKNVPTQIGTATNWKNIDGGINYTAATKTTGTLWTWGENTFGQLGLNDLVNRSTPTQVGTATTWDLVSAGGYHVLASRTYGALFAWGSNDSGQVGNGTITDAVITPTLLINENGWIAVNAGFDFSSVLAVTGKISTWGNNSLGQLGNGTNINDIDVYGSLPCPSNTLSNDDIKLTPNGKVYPNPVSNILYISFDETIVNTSIYNLLGQEIGTKSIHANDGNIDVSSLHSGTYFIKIQLENETKTVKFIKK